MAVIGTLLNAQAQISGHVFRDFDLNGIRSDTLPVETGVPDVVIRMYVDQSKTPVTTTTDAQGNYSFSTSSVPAGKPVRIEFDKLPTDNFNAASGSGSGSSVMFVKSPNTAANLGINYPADYCQRSNYGLPFPAM